MDHKEIEALLRTHEIRPSIYRMKIYEYLIEKRNHPDVDLIYHELINEIPTLSKTTLYNVLELFVQKGLVMPLTIAENELHYDADTTRHGHFRCNSCGAIYDTRIDPEALKFEGMESFEVHDSHIYFWGICPVCLDSRADQ